MPRPIILFGETDMQRCQLDGDSREFHSLRGSGSKCILTRQGGKFLLTLKQPNFEKLFGPFGGLGLRYKRMRQLEKEAGPNADNTMPVTPTAGPHKSSWKRKRKPGFLIQILAEKKRAWISKALAPGFPFRRLSVRPRKETRRNENYKAS